jgi:hypothetical protein
MGTKKSAKSPKPLRKKAMKATKGGILAVQPQVTSKDLTRYSPPPDPVSPGDFRGIAP